MPSVDGEENGEEEVERSPNEDENMSEDDDEDSSLSSDESSSESSSQCPLIFPRFLCCDFSVLVIAIYACVTAISLSFSRRNGE